MKTYELTYIITDALAEDAVGATISEIAKQITSLGGVIMKEEPWGKRRLAYTINKQSHGYYVTIQTHLEGKRIAELERFLRLHTAVLRHLIISITPQATKSTDEQELVEALDKRVEEKRTAPVAKEVEKVVEAAVAEEPETPAEEAPKKRTTKKAAGSEEEKKEENEVERKKLVDEKLSQILGDPEK